MNKASIEFQVFVKPVGALCNLACSYCYYLKNGKLLTKKNSQSMSVELLEKYIIQHIEASSGPTIFFSWHGGEPTLAGLQYFQRIVEIQRKYGPKNCQIVNGLQTNGTLLDENWCRFLSAENFVVGISIDGPSELHSIFRCSVDGRSSFVDAIRGYQLLQSYGITCEILCVVNAYNVAQPLQVYHFFKELKVRFITFLPLVEELPSQENRVSERTVPAKAFGEFLCTIFDEWKANDIGTIKIQIFEEAIRTAFNLEHTLCIFRKTCGGVPVIEKNGDFYSCDHYVDHQHLVGSITETPFVELLESPVQIGFGNIKLSSLPQYCLKCEVRDMCNGGCPKDRFIIAPDGSPGLNYLCEGYQLFFNHCKPFVEQVAEVWRQ
jgi:uncharacterized protein